MNSKILVILGMHRSGTSLLANWLQTCGLDIGQDLLGATKSNQKGHFEDVDFLENNQRFLETRGLDTKGLIHPKRINLSSAEITDIAGVINKRKNKEWSWKEPRTVLFIHEYKKLIPELFSIIVFRHYINVVRSLSRREKRIAWETYAKIKLNKPVNILKKAKALINYYYFDSKYPNLYLEAWIIYNEILLDYHQQNQNMSILINLNDIIENSNNLFDKIKSWGFHLTHKEISTVFTNELLDNSNSFEKPQTLDQTLLKRAESIYKTLATLSLKNE